MTEQYSNMIDNHIKFADFKKKQKMRRHCTRELNLNSQMATKEPQKSVTEVSDTKDFEITKEFNNIHINIENNPFEEYQERLQKSASELQGFKKIFFKHILDSRRF